MSSSLRSLQYTSDVDSSSHHVVRHSTMRNAVRDSVLRVAERDGSSLVHERIDCADPVQPRFRRVEHAFGCLGRYHGVERREEERSESEHGHGRTGRAGARYSDRPDRATCGKGVIGIEGKYRIRDGSQRNYRARGRDAKSCPCHDGARGKHRSDREASGTDRKGKGTGETSRARDSREAFRDSEVSREGGREAYTDQREAPEEAAEQEKTTSFKMKSWSAWLCRQDEKEEA